MSASDPNPQDYYKYDVFLSHSHSQRSWAHDLAERLRDEGLNVWFREWCLQTGENWIRGMVKGIEESRKIILVLSPEFLDTQWPILETYLPVLKDPSARHTRFAPLIHTHCNLPLELVSHQTLDFSDTHGDALRYEFRLAQLMADIDQSRERPTDFDLFCATHEDLPSDALPPVGQLPMGSLMPFLPNPNFVGREEELILLYQELEAADNVSLAPTVVLTGTCGVGKTQLAAEFVYRYGRRFSGGVFWIDVSEESNIPGEVAYCAGAEGMDLPGATDRSQDELVASVMREWRGSQQRLVVFDGLANLDIIDRWKPVSAGTRVLITSRIDGSDPRWEERDIRSIPVDVLPREQSMDLLCRKWCEALDNIDDKRAANAICELLGDLPLALHLAGVYLTKYQYEISLQDYLFGLRSRPVLLNPAFFGSVCDPIFTQRYESLSAMFGDAVSRIAQSDEAQNTDLMAMQLFHIISHFAPVPVSRRLLIKALRMDKSKIKDRQKLADIVSRLSELGLVQSQPGGRIVVHRLLREFAYEHPASDQNVHKVAEDIAKIMSDFASEATQEYRDEELEHLRYVGRESERRGSQLTSVLYSQLAYHLHKNSDLEDAKEYYRRALEIDEAILGPDHATVAMRNSNLGLVLRELGDLDEARVCYKRALEINEAIHGSDHSEVAIIVNNLGRVLYELGDLEGAKENFTRALRIDEAIHGADHPVAARDVNNLGSVLRDLGDLEGAREHFTRALQIDESAYGSDHPNVAALANNLGKVEQELGNLKIAQERYMRALQIDGEVYGLDHLNVARDANNLGTVLHEMGDLEGAEKRFRWALNILERHLGNEHPNTLTARRNLQSLLNDRDRETGAG